MTIGHGMRRTCHCVSRICCGACHFSRTKRVLRRCVGLLTGGGRSPRSFRAELSLTGGTRHVVRGIRSIRVVSDLIISGSSFLSTCVLDRRDNALSSCGSFFRAGRPIDSAICGGRGNSGVCCTRSASNSHCYLFARSVLVSR